MSELAYEQNGIRNTIVKLLGGSASDRQLGDLYDRLKTPNMNGRYTKEMFIKSIRAGKAVQDIVGRFSQLPQLNAPEEPRHEIIAEEGRQIIP